LRKYQLRMQRDKRCTECGRPAVNASQCLEHLVWARERQRAKKGLKRRYLGTVSYELERSAEGRGSIHALPRNSIGINVRDARQHAEWSQEERPKRMLSVRYVQRVESNRQKVSVDVLKRIASALNMNVAELVRDI
jgi:ribosome-binding protein aMBF1 (putative translation factor)